MSLLVGAAIEIGAVAAKTVCKIWLKNVAGGDDLSSDLIDLLKSKTSDAFAQRQGQRLFEKIGDKISREILPVLEEDSSLDEGERNALLVGVVATIGKAKLTPAILLQRNLQPIELKRYLLATSPLPDSASFSADALALYDHILSEVCTYIIDIAWQMPGFTEQTLVEELRREDRIIDSIDQVLADLHRMREDLSPIGKFDRFEKDYREAVARNLDVLQLIGIDVSLQNRRHQLSVAYIKLSASLHQRYRFQPEDRISSQFRNSSWHEADRAVVSVDTTLASAQRLLILGPAGSGKTTLLQWIAVRAATKTFKDQLQEWNGVLPFYIRLRQYGSSDLPRPEEFPKYTAGAILGEMPQGWVHSMLRSGQAILLIDGVDEMAASRREEVHTWLRDLVETYSQCRFIVTSRPHAIEDGWMNHEPFERASLQEMTLVDIFSFIDHWHAAVRQELTREEEKPELGELAEHLKRHIKQIRAVRNLATNPLLCAMFCALNRERRQQLPVNRIELYRACSSLLLERREKDRHIDHSDYPALTYDQKERLLTDVANGMTRKGLSEADTSEVDASFTRSLANMPGVAQGATGKAARSFFVERTGILRELNAGKTDFAHRTFQEFFTALASASSIRYLINHAHLDQWREVIILTAGLARRNPCEQLIKGLLQRGDREPQHRYQLHLLAMSCLETVIELGEETRKEIEARFAQLIPPQNPREAKALAAAGEMVLKHLDIRKLTGEGPLLVSTVAACVRTLALIGEDSALDMLVEYTNDTREMVVYELLHAWERFDREEYAKRVLSRVCEHRTSLEFIRLSSLEGMQHLSHLTALEFSNTQVSDLSPLAGLSNLTILEFSNTQVSDLSPLAGLSNLTILSFADTQVSDLSPLAGLSNLTILEFSNTQVSDLSPLAGLSNLTQLHFAEMQISDLSPLVGLSNLTVLSFSDTPVSDLSPLVGLSNLTALSFSDTPVPDLSPLVGLSNLTQLVFSDTSVSDLSSLASLSNLTQLVFFSTSVSDLSPLASLSNLTQLRLSYMLISDLSSLASLSNLTALDISGTGITNLSPLTGLSNLTALSFADTPVSDFSLLASLSNLTALHLSGTQVSDLSPLASLSNLTTLDISGTQVSDLSPLASLSNLTALHLSNTQVTDLSPLTGLSNLTTLYLPNTRVTDLSPLADLSKLTTLGLSDTPVTDLSPLANLPKLEAIYLTDDD